MSKIFNNTEFNGSRGTTPKTEKTDSVTSQIIEKKIIFNENTPQERFNQSLLWPPVIKLPENDWTFDISEILNNLNKNNDYKKTRSFIKYCVEFLYNCKKDLKLQDHTFTCMTLFFYRYWMLEGSDTLLKLDMDSLSLLLLVIVITSCKTMENHRKVNQYVEVLVARSNPTVKSMTVLDKKKWKLRENLLNNEMQFLAKIKFDLNVINAKSVLDEFYGFYTKYNVDNSDPFMRDDVKFKAQFSLVIKDCKFFITNALTQPMSLLCDGYDFVQYSLVFSAFNFNKSNNLEPKDEKYFKFSPNFFNRKFAKVLTPKELVYIAECQYVLEKNFLHNKTNKGELLLEMTEDIVNDLLDETDLKVGFEGVKENCEQKSNILEPEKAEDQVEGEEEEEKEEKIIKKQKINDDNIESETDIKEPAYETLLEKIHKSNIKFSSKPVESSNYYAENIIDDVNPEYLKFIEKRINTSYEQEAKLQQQQQQQTMK